MSDLIRRASDFARCAHGAIDQRRKYTNQPYIVHPEAVARLVASITDDPVTIAAAWLHDVVEDTPVTIGEIRGEFGDDVARLVADLTNVARKSDGNREKRNAIDRKHSAGADPRAKTVKLADVIHNVTDMARQDPDYAPIYCREKERLLDGLTEGNSELYQQAATLLTRLNEQFKNAATNDCQASPCRPVAGSEVSRPPGRHKQSPIVLCRESIGIYAGRSETRNVFICRLPRQPGAEGIWMRSAQKRTVWPADQTVQVSLPVMIDCGN